MDDLQTLIDRAVADDNDKAQRIQALVNDRIESRVTRFRMDLQYALTHRLFELLGDIITIEFDRNTEVVVAKIEFPVPAKDETFTWVLTKLPDSVFEDERWSVEDPWGNVDVVERNDLRPLLLLDFGRAQAADEDNDGD